MTEPSASRTALPSLDRRTVLKGAAWAAPVIAVATAVPAVSATTAGFDIEIQGLQRGWGFSFFNDALTERISVSTGDGFAIGNPGASDAPAGTTVTVSVDNRVFDLGTAAQVGPEGASSPVPLSPSVSGNVTTYTLVVNHPVPAGADYMTPGTGAVVVTFPDMNTGVEYPNDHLDGYTPSVWALGLSGDADTSNNSWPGTPPEIEPATPWGVHFESHTAGTVPTQDGEVRTIETARAVSVGPNPTPANATFLLSFDSGAIAGVAAEVTLNGSPFTGASLTEQPLVSSARQWILDLGQPLVEGDTVEFAFAYTLMEEPLQRLQDNGAGAVNVWLESHLNDPNQRSTVSVVREYASDWSESPAE
ncbi:hypothetical protein JD276_02195 [Leucobacter sp. CSA1]|uniref:Uncharacterized protein n=1 Tax=Leucobacter chromiisoli TaxID=2796471 RepID=A0A934UTY8_9MICO|nr:hypothetical protein [Leucobacter chromiisoli]MBK0417846.1 hypothetical protein [Leucobacter chromiisoli]